MTCDDDDTVGSNVLPPAMNAHRVSAYVNQTVDSLLSSGFSPSDASSLPPSTLLSGRTPDLIAADVGAVRLGDSEVDAKKFIKAFETELEQSDEAACVGAPEETPPARGPASYNSTDMKPYIRELRSRSQTGLTEEAKTTSNDRRKATNELVAKSDIGRASAHQHDAVTVSPRSLV